MIPPTNADVNPAHATPPNSTFSGIIPRTTKKASTAKITRYTKIAATHPRTNIAQLPLRLSFSIEKPPSQHAHNEAYSKGGYFYDE
jgi:hypothetical protein